MRSITRALTIGLLLATAAPALAQGRGLLDDFSERLGEAVNNRLQAYRETRQQLIDGFCESRLARLTSLHDTVERYQAQISEADLAAYRQALAQEWAYPCPPGGPPTPPQPPRLPPPLQRTDAYRQWDPVSSQIAIDLYEAERDRVAGDCRRRANRLRDAARRIDELTAEISRQGPAFGARFGGAGLDLYRRRLAEELARPCPPGATAPPPAQVATPPMPPAQGITQEDADEVARQQSFFDAAARERREEAERGAAAGSRGSIQLAGGYGESRIPQTGIGVTRNGPSSTAPETDAGQTRDRVSTIGFEGSLLGTVGVVQLRGRAGYTEGDTSTSFDVQPISGGFNGAVFGASSPSGSSGTGAGSVTLTGTTEVSLSRFRLGADVAVAQPTPRSRVFFSFDYYRDVRNYDLSLAGTVGAVQFSQERDQRVVDNIFAVGVGGEASIPLGGALSLVVDAKVQGYLRDSNLRSNERNISNFGPASDRDFRIDIDDSDSGFGVAAELAADLDVAVSPGFSLFAGGSVSYRSQVSGVFNPNSGDQVFFDGLTTALRTEDSWSYGARIGLRVALGRR